eukprot:GILI01009666.1.p1 GENE.GILI01009666.1~~GILI01009666.1.p1  ORF type:complete len:153 (+),score=29.63 GILI01009666.1:71-529(+)
MSETALAIAGTAIVGTFFIASGIEKIADPAPISAVIKQTKFFDWVVKSGIPLNKRNNLNNFTVALGSSLVIAGAMFLFNIRRKLSAGFLSFLVANFTIFVHLNLSNLAATPKKNVVSAYQNFALVGALWMIAFGRPNVEVVPVVVKEAQVAQ